MVADAICDDVSTYISSEIMKWDVLLEVKVKDETFSTCWHMLYLWVYCLTPAKSKNNEVIGKMYLPNSSHLWYLFQDDIYNPFHS